jgi:hypothetical protein
MKKPTPKTVIALLRTDVAMYKARIAELEGHVCPMLPPPVIKGTFSGHWDTARSSA